MSRVIGGAFESAKRFPRVSGDEPPDAGTDTYASVFSPRERG